MHVEEQEEVCLAASGLTALGESLPLAAAAAGTDSDDRQERDSRAGAGSAAGHSYSPETSQGGGGCSWAVGTHSGLSGQTVRSRAARRAEADAVLHPVLRLGWRPLCEVVCNGLHGLLLGGHDKGENMPARVWRSLGTSSFQLVGHAAQSH